MLIYSAGQGLNIKTAQLIGALLGSPKDSLNPGPAEP